MLLMAVKSQIDLPVIFLKEGGQFIAYTPALDLSSSGDTFEEAERHFRETVQIVFEECRRMGTLENFLGEFGWKKEGDRWLSPVMLAENSRTITVDVA
jgi:predicted RNase H-like HicB family nuclease